MKFELELKCDNAAFGENPEFEVKRILHKIAEKSLYISGYCVKSIVDANGNKVGTYNYIND